MMIKTLYNEENSGKGLENDVKMNQTFTAVHHVFQ